MATWIWAISSAMFCSGVHKNNHITKKKRSTKSIVAMAGVPAEPWNMSTKEGMELAAVPEGGMKVNEANSIWTMVSTAGGSCNRKIRMAIVSARGHFLRIEPASCKALISCPLC